MNVFCVSVASSIDLSVNQVGMIVLSGNRAQSEAKGKRKASEAQPLSLSRVWRGDCGHKASTCHSWTKNAVTGVTRLSEPSEESI